MRVNHRRLQTGMPQQCLNHTDIVTGLEQASGERVAEYVGGDLFRDFCLVDSIIKRPLQI